MNFKISTTPIVCKHNNIHYGGAVDTVTNPKIYIKFKTNRFTLYLSQEKSQISQKSVKFALENLVFAKIIC